jgi:hypothetical protein
MAEPARAAPAPAAKLEPHQPAHRAAVCANCSTPTPDAFCGHCGQRNLHLHLSLREVVGEAIEEAFGVDSRIVHTVRPFLLQPGELTRDYLAGRRARYTSPLKLYVVTSAIFFLTLALRGDPMRIHVGGKPSGTPQVGVSLPADKAEADQVRRELKSSGWLGGKLADSFDKLSGATPERRTELADRLSSDVVALVAKAMFLLVPLFAALLALFFRRAGRFYVEHLVFALHLHAFGFLLQAIAVGLRVGWLRAATLAGIVAYLFMALRAVYGEGRARTLFKLLALFAGYGLLVSAAIAAAALISLVQL